MPKKQKKQYGPGGQYYRKRIKRPDGSYEDVYGKTLTELSEKVTLRQNQLAALSKVPPREMFFFEYAAAWYARKAPHMSDGMRKMYEHQINKVICPVIGGKPIREITSDDLLDVMATRAELSQSSNRKTVLVLKQIFDAALDADVIDKLPTRRLKSQGKKSPPKKALSPEQQAALLEAVHGLSVEPFVMLALYTGMRREEICGLRWDAVELDGAAPFVEVRRACRWPANNQPEVAAILKSDAACRCIPIPPQLVTYLRQLKDNLSDKDVGKIYVYGTKDGGPVSLTTFRRRWEGIRCRSTASGRALGEKIRNHRHTVVLDFYPNPHQLRRTYITRLILGGMDLKRVQYLAGHADPQITLQTYTDLMGHSPEELIADISGIFDTQKE